MSGKKTPYHCWINCKSPNVGDFIRMDLSATVKEKGMIVFGIIDEERNIIEKNYGDLMNYIYDGYVIITRDKKIKEVLDGSK